MQKGFFLALQIEFICKAAGFWISLVPFLYNVYTILIHSLYNIQTILNCIKNVLKMFIF